MKQISLPLIGVAILMDGTHHWINQKTLEQIYMAQRDEFIQPDPEKLTMFRVSSISQLLTAQEYHEKYPHRFGYSYGQPAANLKALDGPVSNKSMAECMEEYIKTHPENLAVKKFYDQFKAWKKKH